MKYRFKSIFFLPCVLSTLMHVPQALSETETSPPAIGQKPDPYQTQFNNWSNWSALNQMYMQKAIEDDAMRRAQEEQAAEREALRKAAEEAEAKKTPEQKRTECLTRSLNTYHSCQTSIQNTHQASSNSCNYYYYGAAVSGGAGIAAGFFSMGAGAAVGGAGATLLTTQGYVCQQGVDGVRDKGLQTCQYDRELRDLNDCR